MREQHTCSQRTSRTRTARLLPKNNQYFLDYRQSMLSRLYKKYKQSRKVRKKELSAGYHNEPPKNVSKNSQRPQRAIPIGRSSRSPCPSQNAQVEMLLNAYLPSFPFPFPESPLQCFAVHISCRAVVRHSISRKFKRNKHQLIKHSYSFPPPSASPAPAQADAHTCP